VVLGMRKIKLLHVTSSLKIGGAERILCDLVRTLGNQGFEHHVIYFHEGPNVQKIKSYGAKTYKITGFICLYDLCFFTRLFCLIKKIDPDVVHSLLWSANIATRFVAKILKKPLLSVYHSHIDDSFARNFIDKMTRGLSDLNITVSADIAKSLGKRFLCKASTRIIPNGIDFDHIHTQSQCKSNIIKREDLRLSKDDFVIGAVGRFCPVKNFPLLLNSFSLVSTVRKSTKLVIVGIGPLESKLRELAYKLKITDKVRFVIGKQAHNYYSIFDCFVQSSLHEGFSIALLEAMSFELPCIVTNKGEHPVIIHNKNGIIVESESQSMLYEALLTILDNRAFAKKMAKNSKSDVLERFSGKKMVNKYKSLFCLLYSRYTNRKSNKVG